MAEFDMDDLRKRYELVCQDFPSDLKREYQEVKGFVENCLKLKERFTNDYDKELTGLLNTAATIMGGRAYKIIEEAPFQSATFNCLKAQLTPLQTSLSTCASAVRELELSVSQDPLTDDRVAHLKAFVEDKYDLYHNWYKKDTPVRDLKRNTWRLQHTYSQQMDWLDQKISNNSLIKIQINELVDTMNKHMETWPGEKDVKDVVEDLRTKAKGYDCVSQSLDADKIRLKSLQGSLESLIKEVFKLIDRLLDIKKEYDVKLFKIYTIKKADFPVLDAYLFGSSNQRHATFSPQTWKLIFEVTSIVPINKLELLLAAEPISDITIVECRDHIQYAYLKTAEEGDILVTEDQWVKLMGPVKNQLQHDICWAFVTAELVSAVRHICQYDPAVVEYSCRDLVDFVAPEKRSKEKTKEGRKHFCYSHGLREGFEYVKVNGIVREESRPFEADCREDVPTRHGSNRGYIGEVVSLTTVKDVLHTLRKHPVAGCIPVFEPDYCSISDQVFTGPTSPLSYYATMHAISFVGAGGVKEGEKHFNSRSSHGVDFGKDGYMKVCYQHVIMCLTRGHYMRYIEDPVLLPGQFFYPELLSREKEEEKRRNETIC